MVMGTAPGDVKRDATQQHEGPSWGDGGAPRPPGRGAGYTPVHNH